MLIANSTVTAATKLWPAVLACTMTSSEAVDAVFNESLWVMRACHALTLILTLGVVAVFLIRGRKGWIQLIIAALNLALSLGWNAINNAGNWPDCTPRYETYSIGMVIIASLCFVFQLIYWHRTRLRRSVELLQRDA